MVKIQYQFRNGEKKKKSFFFLVLDFTSSTNLIPHFLTQGKRYSTSKDRVLIY